MTYENTVEMSKDLLQGALDSLAKENLTKDELLEILTSIATDIRNGKINLPDTKKEPFITLAKNWKNNKDLSKSNVIDFINTVKKFV